MTAIRAAMPGSWARSSSVSSSRSLMTSLNSPFSSASIRLITPARNSSLVISGSLLLGLFLRLDQQLGPLGAGDHDHVALVASDPEHLQGHVLGVSLQGSADGVDLGGLVLGLVGDQLLSHLGRLNLSLDPLALGDGL